MLKANSVILLYSTDATQGQLPYKLLDLFSFDMVFSHADYKNFFEKKFLTKLPLGTAPSFKTYQELETFAVYIAEQMNKEELCVVDHLSFNQALYHHHDMNSALDYMAKKAKKITLVGQKTTKSGVFGRIFRT